MGWFLGILVVLDEGGFIVRIKTDLMELLL
jgi:hypothetical protein